MRRPADGEADAKHVLRVRPSFVRLPRAESRRA
jgi:hypothetical protein